MRGRLRAPLAHLLIVLGLGSSESASIVSTCSSRWRGDAVRTLLQRRRVRRRRRWTPGRKRSAWQSAIVLAVAGWKAQPRLTCVRLDGPWMPEREAGAFIVANALSGRMLTWFDWGQYMIWHSAPQVKVSMDGRRETVYSDTFVAQHLRCISTRSQRSLHRTVAGGRRVAARGPAADTRHSIESAGIGCSPARSRSCSRAGRRRLRSAPPIVHRAPVSQDPERRCPHPYGPRARPPPNCAGRSGCRGWHSPLAAVRDQDRSGSLGTRPLRARLPADPRAAVCRSVLLHAGTAMGQSRVGQRGRDGRRLSAGRSAGLVLMKALVMAGVIAVVPWRLRGASPADRGDRDDSRARRRAAAERHGAAADLVGARPRAAGAC